MANTFLDGRLPGALRTVTVTRPLCDKHTANSTLHVRVPADIKNVRRAAVLTPLEDCLSGIGRNICNARYVLVLVDWCFGMPLLLAEMRLKHVDVVSDDGSAIGGPVLIDRIGVMYYGVVVESN